LSQADLKEKRIDKNTGGALLRGLRRISGLVIQPVSQFAALYMDWKTGNWNCHAELRRSLVHSRHPEVEPGKNEQDPR
jgi:hypothetical protein